MTPEGWRRVAIRDMGDGKRPAVKAGPFGSALKKSSYAASGYRVYGQEQVIAGDFSIGDYFIDDEKFMTLRSCEVIPGDLLVSLVGTFGKVVVVPQDAEPGIINPRLLRLAPDRSRVWSPFLRACLCSPAVQKGFSAAAQGGTMGVLNASTIGPIEVALPPLPEQRKIAAILSSVDNAIEGTQAVIDQLQVVKKAMMADLLTRGIPGRHKKFKQTEIGEVPEEWDVVPVDHWLRRLIDYRGKSPPKASGGIPLVTAKNVRDGFINAEPREFISDDSYDTWMTRGIPDAGDILFTTEAPLGKAASVPTTKIALGQRLITLCPQRDHLDPTYLLWVLLCPAFQELLRSKATGSTVQGIKQSVFRTLPISIPPLDEQVVIAQAIQSVADQGSVEGAYLVSLRTVKSALMSVLLTGEVRVCVDGEKAA